MRCQPNALIKVDYFTLFFTRRKRACHASSLAGTLNSQIAHGFQDEIELTKIIRLNNHPVRR